jgi:hypothetical protein
MRLAASRRPGPKTITMWGQYRKPRGVFRARGFLIQGGPTARRSSGHGEPQTISLKPDGGALVGGDWGAERLA